MSQLLRYSKNYFKLTTQLTRVCSLRHTSTTTQATVEQQQQTKTDSTIVTMPQQPFVQPFASSTTTTTTQSLKDIFKPRLKRTLFSIISDLKDSYSIYRLNNSELIDEALALVDNNTVNKSMLIYLMDIISNHLEYVLPEQRQAKLDYLWEKIQTENLIEIDSNFYYLYLKGILNLNVKPELIEQIINEMKEKNVEITPQILELQFEMYCHMGQIDKTKELLQNMKQQSFSINANIFNSLITVYLNTNNETEALQIYDIMKARNLNPDSNTYFNIYRHYLINEPNNAKLLEYREKMRQDNVRFDIKAFARLINECIYFLQDFNFEQLNYLFKTFINEYSPAYLYNYNVWLELFFQKNKHDDATLVLNHVLSKYRGMNHDSGVAGAGVEDEANVVNEDLSQALTQIIEDAKKNVATKIGSEVDVTLGLYAKNLLTLVKADKSDQVVKLADDLAKLSIDRNYIDKILNKVLFVLAKTNSIYHYTDILAKSYTKLNIKANHVLPIYVHCLEVAGRVIPNDQVEVKNYQSLAKLIDFYIHLPTAVPLLPYNDYAFLNFGKKFRSNPKALYQLNDYMLNHAWKPHLKLEHMQRYDMLLTSMFVEQLLDYMVYSTTNVDNTENLDLFEAGMRAFIRDNNCSNYAIDTSKFSKVYLELQDGLFNLNEHKVDFILETLGFLRKNGVDGWIMYSMNEALTHTAKRLIGRKDQQEMYIRLLQRHDIRINKFSRIRGLFDKIQLDDDINRISIRLSIKPEQFITELQKFVDHTNNVNMVMNEADIETAENFLFYTRIFTIQNLSLKEALLNTYICSINRTKLTADNFLLLNKYRRRANELFKSHNQFNRKFFRQQTELNLLHYALNTKNFEILNHQLRNLQFSDTVEKFFVDLNVFMEAILLTLERRTSPLEFLEDLYNVFDVKKKLLTTPTDIINTKTIRQIFQTSVNAGHLNLVEDFNERFDYRFNDICYETLLSVKQFDRVMEMFKKDPNINPISQYRIIDYLVENNQVDELQTFTNYLLDTLKIDISTYLNNLLCALLRSQAPDNDAKIANLLNHENFKLSKTAIISNVVYMKENHQYAQLKDLVAFIKNYFSKSIISGDFKTIIKAIETNQSYYTRMLKKQLVDKKYDIDNIHEFNKLTSLDLKYDLMYNWLKSHGFKRKYIVEYLCLNKNMQNNLELLDILSKTSEMQQYRGLKFEKALHLCMNKQFDKLMDELRKNASSVFTNYFAINYYIDTTNTNSNQSVYFDCLAEYENKLFELFADHLKNKPDDLAFILQEFLKSYRGKNKKFVSANRKTDTIATGDGSSGSTATANAAAHGNDKKYVFPMSLNGFAKRLARFLLLNKNYEQFKQLCTQCDLVGKNLVFYDIVEYDFLINNSLDSVKAIMSVVNPTHKILKQHIYNNLIRIDASKNFKHINKIVELIKTNPINFEELNVANQKILNKLNLKF